MIISNNGLNLIKRWEGCSLTAYTDCVGVWTIGWGTTNADKSITGTVIKKGLKISQTTANKWFADSVIKKYCPKVDKYMKEYGFNQNQYDALVSFAYNVGSIDQLTANGTRDINTIADMIPKYNKAGGKVVKGLTDRRMAEYDLFMTKAYDRVDFIKDIQNGIGAVVDGVAGPETLSKTITVSATVNRKHAVVAPIQRYLHSMGYDCGVVDGIAGSKFTSAVKSYQHDNGCVADGEITAQKLTWQNLLDYYPRPEKEPEPVNYLEKVVDAAAVVYKEAIGCTHGGDKVSQVRTLETLKLFKTLTCNRVASIALQQAGCLEEGFLVSHTAKKSGKKTIEDAVSNVDKLRHGKVVWVNKYYRDLPAEYKKPGCAYWQNSNACIAGPDGKIYSCNESKDQMDNKKYKITLRKSGYPFTSKILVAFIPDEV